MDLVGDAIEVLLVVAVGGMLGSAVLRLRRGQVDIPRCPGCGRVVSRAAPRCRGCGGEL